jgi:hypothetical protein
VRLYARCRVKARFAQVHGALRRHQCRVHAAGHDAMHTATMLQALVYESRADARLTDAELEVVLIGSRVRNARRGITGVLLKRGDRIAQYLEGEPAAIERTFAAITASTLHHDVSVLDRIDGVTRIFDRWHMGFHGFHADHRRAASTDEWLDSLQGVRAGQGTNPALDRLVACWDAFAAGA